MPFIFVLWTRVKISVWYLRSSWSLYGFWILLPRGVKYLAVVSRNAEPSERVYCSCTSPFPKLLLPIMVARSRSCSAPAMISLADAEPSLINTVIFPVSNIPGRFALYSFLGWFSPMVYTNNWSPPINSSTISTASSRIPPPLSLRSSTNDFMPCSFRPCMASMNSLYVFDENLFKRK